MNCRIYDFLTHHFGDGFGVLTVYVVFILGWIYLSLYLVSGSCWFGLT